MSGQVRAGLRWGGNDTGHFLGYLIDPEPGIIQVDCSCKLYSFRHVRRVIWRLSTGSDESCKPRNLNALLHDEHGGCAKRIRTRELCDGYHAGIRSSIESGVSFLQKGFYDLWIFFISKTWSFSELQGILMRLPHRNNPRRKKIGRNSSDDRRQASGPSIIAEDGRHNGKTQGLGRSIGVRCMDFPTETESVQIYLGRHMCLKSYEKVIVDINRLLCRYRIAKMLHCHCTRCSRHIDSTRITTSIGMMAI